MKNLLLAIGLGVALTYNVNAASVTRHLAANTSNSLIITNAASISSIAIANTNAATLAYVVFFDAPSITNGYNLAAYTSVAYSVPALVTNLYTNFFGVLNSNVFTVVTNTYTTNAAAVSQLYPTVLAVEAGITNTTIYAWQGRVTMGLLATNNGSCDVTVVYRQ